MIHHNNQNDPVSHNSPDLLFQGLITVERLEKFNLLGQLILNQREAIILSGGEGMGKTTFLNALKKNRADIWIICLLSGLTALSFEQVQNQLVLAIQEYNPNLQRLDLEIMLKVCAQRQQTLVLAIDDAACLPVGLVNTLIEYALHHPVIRIIFALTKEQLYLKSVTDQAVDNCYFVEIPPLSKVQTSAFIQDISVLQGTNKKISHRSLARIYQRTAGVPGKIIAELPFLFEIKHQGAVGLSKLILFAGCFTVGIVAIYNLSEDKKQLAPSLVSPQLDSAKPSLKQPVGKQDVKSHPITDKKPTHLVKQTELPPEKLATAKNTQTIQQLTDDDWVLQQDAKKYTLQLMALSKPQPLLNVVKSYPKLQASLKVFQLKRKNLEKYVLLYGSFANATEANKTINLLPVEFKQAWPRRFDTLQK
jgi:DamX protein